MQQKISTKKFCPYGQHFFVGILCFHIFCPQKTHKATLFYSGTCIEWRRHLVTASTSVVMRISIVVRHKNMEAKYIHKEILPIWAAFLCAYPLLPYFLPTKNAQSHAVL
jgi:hypothetical protein